MCDFKPGDEVVCVDADWLGILTLNAVYTIRDVLPDLDSCGERGVTLMEAEAPFGPPGCPPGFRASRFRKVQRRTGKLNLTEWLSQPSDFEEPKRAPAPLRPDVPSVAAECADRALVLPRLPGRRTPSPGASHE